MSLKEEILFFWIFSMVVSTTLSSQILAHGHCAMESLMACGIGFWVR
jgi:hypothetical protein